MTVETKNLLCFIIYLPKIPDTKNFSKNVIPKSISNNIDVLLLNYRCTMYVILMK